MKLLSLTSLLLIAAPFTAYSLPTYGEGDNFPNERSQSLKVQKITNPQTKAPNFIYQSQGVQFPDRKHNFYPGYSDDDFNAYKAPTYVVKPGDSLSKIANENGYHLQVVIAANPEIKNPNVIYPGQIITLPNPMYKPVDSLDAPFTTNSCSTYEVKSGDTLYKIANENGLTLRQLISANPQIPDPNSIYPGQKINIPKLEE